MDLSKHYDPKQAESKWQQYWEEHHIFKFDATSKKPIYSIDTPPPTVSGKMHLGHAFSYSQGDFIARYQRMKGNNVFYPFGTDDNGLATERLIEKTKKVTSKKMERDAFIKLCLETLEEIRPAFIQDWKRIGMSCDFSIFYSTINDHCRKISQKSFIDLYKKGRIYQKKAPIIFCPACKTAIAQVEMEDVEKDTTLNYIKAKMDTGEYLIYATTRPELHPGCVGISLDEQGNYVTAQRDNGEKWIISQDAVEKMNIEFPMKVLKRFKGKELVGKKVNIPFSQNQVSVTHDISAKTGYGSGIVFYCTYGGLDCVEWMVRHPDVKPVLIMDESGRYNELSPYPGMNSTDARKAILTDLEQKGALLKKEPLHHTVNVHERCGTDIEYVATTQWFVKYLDLREQFLDAGARLQWYPAHMKVRYDNWIKGLNWDWCISRQRHFGIPIPVWYDERGKVILPDEDQLPVDPLKDKPKDYKGKVIAEKDVLDTWATSSMTPQLAIELFDDEKLKKKLFPMSLRPQAHDIITFWLFNTLVKSQLHYGVNPWKDVVISGHAQDPHGRKMSKSKGNIIEPQVMVDKYSADALRFWAAGSKLGDDLPFMEKDLMTGQKFSTKLWNASKFCFTHLDDYKESTVTEVFDQWLLSKLQQVISECTSALDEYEYARAKAAAEQFFWHTFCDNYLEIVKDRLYNPALRGEKVRHSAQQGLYVSLLSILKLMAPIMPHITEEIYHLYFASKEKTKSIHISSWPQCEKKLVNEDAEHAGDIGIDIINTVRKYKSENKWSMKEEITEIILVSEDNNFQKRIQSIEGDLKAVLNVKKISLVGKTSLETLAFKVKVGMKK
ncbi:MAG TPA: valine--tRNA ligase [Candidatus Nanoarchaeia archaeon]|nr:valine--tRNA ligase [Candidatus Nanoarchaeia archaeon]